jgi:Domain of unknown function (DUF4388)
MPENNTRDPGAESPASAPPRSTPAAGIPTAPRLAPPPSPAAAAPAAPPPAGAGTGAGTGGSGFAAQFEGTSLWDLIQFECLRRAERIVRIASRGQVGFLFFRGGNVVHASTLRNSGEAAVREMLEWTSGVIEPWSGRWPEREAITVPWQSLLLGAAQAADRASDRGGRIYLPPTGAAAPAAAPAAEAAAARAPEAETVVLARNGQIVKGHKVRGLPEAAAYAAQMADLIGEYLGLEGFHGLEASFATVHYLVARDREGGLVARRAGDPVYLEPLKRELGL